MNKIFKKAVTLAGLLTITAALSACSKKEEVPETVSRETAPIITVTTTAAESTTAVNATVEMTTAVATTESVTEASQPATEPVTETSAEATTAATEPSTEATTEATTEAVTAATTEAATTATQPATTAASQSEKPAGGWDLASLSNKCTPYGNNLDDQTSTGIPQGVFYYKRLWGKYNVDFISNRTEEKVIYLTMDCGFDNPETALILDTLKEKNVKATFFVTSMFYNARPDLIQRMIDEGHRIGSHSINHKNMTTLDIATQTNEIMDVVNKLKNDFGYDCKLFRFPEGQFSDQTLALVDNLGLKSVFWSYAYNDYSATQPPVDESLAKAVKYVHPGAIYLLHASSSTNRAFLGDWIDQVRGLGYEFAGVYPID